MLWRREGIPETYIKLESEKAKYLKKNKLDY